MFGHTVKAKCGHSVFSLSPAGAHGSEIKGGQFALINAARLKMSPQSQSERSSTTRRGEIKVPPIDPVQQPDWSACKPKPTSTWGLFNGRSLCC